MNSNNDNVKSVTVIIVVSAIMVICALIAMGIFVCTRTSASNTSSPSSDGVKISVRTSDNAFISSIEQLDHCGRATIANLVRNTLELASNNEVSAAKQTCSEIRIDKSMLLKADADNNHFLELAYENAISKGSPADIAKRMQAFELGGVVYYVNSRRDCS